MIDPGRSRWRFGLQGHEPAQTPRARSTPGDSAHPPAWSYDVCVICPNCGKDNDKVIDSRASDGGKVVRRRRECLECGRRFTTYERAEPAARLMVIKRDGTRQPFDRDKVLRGIQVACGKRPIGEDVMERSADEIEEEIHRQYDREVPSRAIGELVKAKLRDIAEVAYIRFASEYDQFKSLEEIKSQIELLGNRVKDVKDQQKLF